jgi:hypothetical protein
VISHISVTLRCDKCGREQSFDVKTTTQARVAAELQGWARPGYRLDLCPICADQDLGATP